MCWGAGILLWSPADVRVTKWFLVAQGPLGTWALHTNGFLQGLLLAQLHSEHSLEQSCWPNRGYVNVFQIHMSICVTLQKYCQERSICRLKESEISNQQLPAMWSWAVFYPLLAEVFSWAPSAPAVCRCAALWAGVYFPPTLPKSKPRSVAEINRYFWHMIPSVCFRLWLGEPCPRKMCFSVSTVKGV